jgi:hypothetical protein
VAEEHAGKSAKCPGCQQMLTIPRSSPTTPVRSAPAAPARSEAITTKRTIAGQPANGTPAPKSAKTPGRPVPAPARKQRPQPEEEDIPEVEALDEDEEETFAEEVDDDEAIADEVDDEEEVVEELEEVDEEEEEEERPRKKKRPKKKGKKKRWRGEWADCPHCDAPGDADRLYYTMWGGFIGPMLICHVRCNRCGTAYNGKHGDSNTGRIAIFVGVSIVIGLVFGVIAVVLESL